MKRRRSDCCDVPCYNAELVERLSRAAPGDGVVGAIADLFALLGDPTRVRLLSALAHGEEVCVCDVANVVGLSLSATSHQLRKLRECGAVTFRSDGRMAYYHLTDGFLVGLLAQARLQLERQPAKRAALR